MFKRNVTADAGSSQVFATHTVVAVGSLPLGNGGSHDSPWGLFWHQSIGQWEGCLISSWCESSIPSCGLYQLLWRWASSSSSGNANADFLFSLLWYDLTRDGRAPCYTLPQRWRSKCHTQTLSSSWYEWKCSHWFFCFLFSPFGWNKAVIVWNFSVLLGCPFLRLQRRGSCCCLWFTSIGISRLSTCSSLGYMR